MDKFCTNCGGPLNEGDVFCQNCAEPVRVKSTPLSFLKNIKLNKKHLIIAGGALAMILIVSVFLKGFGKQTEEAFQYIIGDENYLYYNEKLIEIDEEFYNINERTSFIYKQTAVLDLGGSLVLVDLKKGDHERIKNVSFLSFSKEHGRLAYLDKDEVILRDLDKPSKEILITEDVSRYYANETFTRFYVIDEDEVLSVFGDNGKVINEEILEDIEAENFYVIDDTFLIYQDGDVIVYNIKTEDEVEVFKDEYLQRVYDSKTDGNYIVQTNRTAYVITKDTIEEFEIGDLYYQETEDTEITWIQSYSDDERILFNLQALSGDVDFEKVKLDRLREMDGGFVSYDYGDDSLEVFRFKKGAAVPEILEVSLEEDIEDMVLFNDKHLIYFSDDEMIYYNGKKEFELPFELEDISDFYFDGSKGAYFILEDEVHYLSNNGKTSLIFDEEDIWDVTFSENTGDLMFTDSDEQLYVASNGKKAKLVAEDVEAVMVSKGMHFYYMDDTLYAYVNGKSKLIGEDMELRVY